MTRNRCIIFWEVTNPYSSWLRPDYWGKKDAQEPAGETPCDMHGNCTVSLCICFREGTAEDREAVTPVMGDVGPAKWNCAIDAGEAAVATPRAIENGGHL